MSVTWKDLNGIQFYPNAAGERMDSILHESRKVMWPDGMPVIADWTKIEATDNKAGTFTYCGRNLRRADVVLSDLQVKQFLQSNYAHLILNGKSESVARYCSIIRLVATICGAMAPNWAQSTTGRRVFYNEVTQLDAKETKTLCTAGEFKLSNGGTITIAEFTAPKSDLEKIKTVYPDMLGCVAFVFRGRGHHYTSDLESVYNNLWKACKRSDTPLPLTWEEVATTGLHAIYPDVLDISWKAHADLNECSGALKTRWISVAAGTASISNAAKNGRDLMSSGLAVTSEVANQIRYALERDELIIHNRWDGSVNHILYDAKPIDFEESKCAALAASSMSIIRKFNPESKMLQAKSLIRMANSSPITSAVIGSVMGYMVEKMSEDLAKRAIADKGTSNSVILARRPPRTAPPIPPSTVAGTTTATVTPISSTATTTTPTMSSSSSSASGALSSSALAAVNDKVTKLKQMIKATPYDTADQYSIDAIEVLKDEILNTYGIPTQVIDEVSDSYNNW